MILVLGSALSIARVPLGRFWRAARQPFLLAFSTASSEAALPIALENMERFGVPKHIVGFVLPAGYSFNLDGSTLYLARRRCSWRKRRASTCRSARKY